MITRHIINDKIRFFQDSNVFTFSDLSHKIDRFKNGILKIDSTLNFSAVMGMDSIDFDTIAFLFALFELKIPITNARSQEVIFTDKSFHKCKIFIRADDSSLIEKFSAHSLDIHQIEDLLSSAHVKVPNNSFNDQELILTYFSSGTTGAPKKFFHSHLSVLESAKNSKRFYNIGDTMLWRQDLSMNHFGILTTSILPAMMFCDNIVIYDKLADNTRFFKSLSNHSIRIDTALILAHSRESLQPFRFLFNKEAKIITGGRNFAGEIYQAAKSTLLTNNCKIFNVYGCTELATPLMWRCLETNKSYTLEDFVTFDEHIEGLEIIPNENGMIEGFKPHPVFFSDDEESLKIPDDIKIDGNRHIFINRKQLTVFAPSVVGGVEVTFQVNDLHIHSFLISLTDGLITYLRIPNRASTNGYDSATLEIFTERSLEDSLSNIHLKFFNFMKVEFNVTIDCSWRIFSGITIVPDISSLHNGLKFDSTKLKDLLVK